MQNCSAVFLTAFGTLFECRWVIGGEDERTWKIILEDVLQGHVEISRRCTAVFAQMLFSACEAYYAAWEEMDEEIVLPQARSLESDGLCTKLSINLKSMF